MIIKSLKINKKAQLEPSGTFSIFQFMVVAFLVVVLFAGLIWSWGAINNVMHQVGVQNDITTNNGANSQFSFPCLNNASQICHGSTYVNMTKASDDIFGQMNSSIQALRMVAVVYILGLAVLIIVTAFMERKHPVFFFAYILIALLAIIFAPTISNAYISLLNSGMMDNILSTFTAANYLVINLPMIVMIISLLGGIGLFVNLIRGGGESL